MASSIHVDIVSAEGEIFSGSAASTIRFTMSASTTGSGLPRRLAFFAFIAKDFH